MPNIAYKCIGWDRGRRGRAINHCTHVEVMYLTVNLSYLHLSAKIDFKGRRGVRVAVRYFVACVCMHISGLCKVFFAGFCHFLLLGSPGDALESGVLA